MGQAQAMALLLDRHTPRRARYREARTHRIAVQAEFFRRDDGFECPGVSVDYRPSACMAGIRTRSATGVPTPQIAKTNTGVTPPPGRGKKAADE
jgi:hypothetical protein